ncbi:MAG: TrmB family transcriptional regulator [Candidatus Kariarchaeaceae archaeon]|jgi:sugar-specific transcriptional regulator TrmB
MQKIITLSDLLSETGYFQSIHEVKVLTHLVRNPLKDTVKDICDETGLPDSKVYPALKQLVDLGLILKDTSHRPARYSFTEPSALEDYLQHHFDKEMEQRKNGISKINEQIVNLWNPGEPELGPVAYLYRGNAIYNEILRIMKNTKEKIVLILSDSFEPYFETLMAEIPKLSKRDVRIELAVPASLVKGNEEFITSGDKLMKVKSSLTIANSYIVRDQTTMLNIIHRRQESVAMLTNDQLLVEYIDSCWNNTACCTSPNFQYENPDLLNLDVLEQ